MIVYPLRKSDLHCFPVFWQHHHMKVTCEENCALM
jgi:hypothetical protein